MGFQQALQERDAAPEDVRVLRALRGIFDVFAAPPDARAADGAAGARDAPRTGGAQPAAGGAHGMPGRLQALCIHLRSVASSIVQAPCGARSA